MKNSINYTDENLDIICPIDDDDYDEYDREDLLLIDKMLKWCIDNRRFIRYP